jgi:hypothetical protein
MIKIVVYISKSIITVLAALLFNSCQFAVDLGDNVKGSGNIATEKREVTEDFTNIEVSQGIDLVITQSDTKSIQVEADDNIIEHIKTTISSGVLTIKMDKSVRTKSSRKVKVSLPTIEALSSSSGATITNNGLIKSASLDIDASSGSEIDLFVEAENLIGESSSGSEVNLTGKALKIEVNSSSGSEINASELLTNEVIAGASSGSSIDIHPIISLNAKASSGSIIKYHNLPKNITKSASSGGSVSKI